ncbi:hypothetical protein [Rhodoferax koreensis]|uniref:hypothetical protein n=1 Tax=Rhodoferax koreensis TaxID=1842727 RepID=UPI0012FFA642|nr:hypothetical protein [Rhodoferax koreense]
MHGKRQAEFTLRADKGYEAKEFIAALRAMNALLKRLDKAIGQFYDDGDMVDEINGY